MPWKEAQNEWSAPPSESADEQSSLQTPPVHPSRNTSPIKGFLSPVFDASSLSDNNLRDDQSFDGKVLEKNVFTSASSHPIQRSPHRRLAYTRAFSQSRTEAEQDVPDPTIEFSIDDLPEFRPRNHRAFEKSSCAQVIIGNAEALGEVGVHKEKLNGSPVTGDFSEASSPTGQSQYKAAEDVKRRPINSKR